jgi:hypothetical protein
LGRWVITRDEKPARIVPEGRSNLKEIRAAAAGLRDLRQRIARRLGGRPKLTKAHIKLLVEEGRFP